VPPEQELRVALGQLLMKKQAARELEVQLPHVVLHRFIQRELTRLQPLAATMSPVEETTWWPLNRLCQSVAQSVLRLLVQSIAAHSGWMKRYCLRVGQPCCGSGAWAASHRRVRVIMHPQIERALPNMV
jgi:hypothetical protein